MFTDTYNTLAHDVPTPLLKFCKEEW